MKKSNTVLSDSRCVIKLTFMIILHTYDNHDCMYFVDEKLKSSEVVSEFAQITKLEIGGKWKSLTETASVVISKLVVSVTAL